MKTTLTSLKTQRKQAKQQIKNFTDTQRLDWLASLDNKIGTVLLPRQAKEAASTLREAIDFSMENEKRS